MAQVYLKDKKIDIYTIEYILDDLLQEIEVKVMIAENIWAYYRQASAKEYYAAAQVNYKVDAIFKIAWREGVAPDMTISYKGKEYNITRIDDFEGYKQDLTIYATTKGA